MSKIRVYVGIVSLMAVVWGVGMYLHGSSVTAAMLPDVMLLCALAVTGELLAFLLPRSASGSVGFIPYFAAAIVVPGWPSVLSVALVKTVVELWSRRAPMKATLNVAAHA